MANVSTTGSSSNHPTSNGPSVQPQGVPRRVAPILAAAAIILVGFVAVVLLLRRRPTEPTSGRASLGQLDYSVTDLTVPAGVLTLTVERKLDPEQEAPGLLGSPWRLNWELSLVQLAPIALLSGPNGVIVFEQEGDSPEYRSNSSGRIRFEGDGHAVRLRPCGRRETFDSLGRLVERDHRNGNTETLRYDADGRLERVDGPHGSFLTFEYNDAGLLSKVTASTGDTVHYVHGERGIQEVRLNGALVVRYTYDDHGRLAAIEDPATGSVAIAYDARGRVIRRRWADGSEERREYDDATGTRTHIDPTGTRTTFRSAEDGRREEIADALGNRTQLEYDDAGRLVSVADPDGGVTRLTYDARGRTTSTTDRSGAVTRYEYAGESNQAKSVLYPDGSRHDMEYDGNGNLTAVKDGETVLVSRRYHPNGLVAAVSGRGIPERKFDYYPSGLLRAETDALGHSTTFEYDQRGNLTRQTDPAGGTSTWTYDDRGRVASETDAEGGVTRYEYDAKGQLVSRIDPLGGVTQFEHDAAGRLVAETDPAGRTTRYKYDKGGVPSSIIDAAGHAWHLECDAAGNLTRETDPLGAVSAYTYDALGRLAIQADAAGRTWRYERLPDGAVARVTGPDGSVTRYAYSPDGALLSITAPGGRMTRYERDKAGRVVKTTSAGGLAITCAYDEAGNLVHEADNAGTDRRCEHDLLGRVGRERWPTGYELSYTYDPLGNVTKTQDNRGRAWTYQYDRLGRLVRSVGPSSAATTYRYDPAGRLVEEADPAGLKVLYTYTAVGDLSSVTLPSGEATRYAYDPSGSLAEVRRPGKGVTKLAHDGLGNRTRFTDPLGRATEHAYDKLGRLVRTTDAKGQATTFTYDAADRTAQKRTADGRIVTYTYNEAGDLIEVSDGAFPVRHTYNDAGQLTQTTYPTLKRTLKYEYAEGGLVAKFMDPEGRAIQYERDDHKRLKAIRLPDGKAIAYAYDAPGRLVGIEYPNGVKGTWEYDSESRIIRVAYADREGKALVGWRYTYDAAGQLVQCIAADGRTTTYTYDPAGRLLEERRPSGTIRYSYLPGGNRGTRESGGKEISYSYDDADQLLKAGDEAFEYDANGHLVARRGPAGTTRYAYDAEGNLTKVTRADGAEVRFGYAPTGERLWREDNAGRTWFVTDGVNLLAELDSDLRPKATYLHGPGIDQPLVMWRDGQQLFYHRKALGTIAALTDAGGGLVAAYETDAFGNLEPGAKAAVANPFLFTAREHEPELGLYYYRARYYDPSLGRFLSPDALDGSPDDPRTLNRYAYACNAPTRLIDPLGLFNLKEQLTYFQERHNLPPSQVLRLVREEHMFRRVYNRVQEQLDPGAGQPTADRPALIRRPRISDSFQAVDDELTLATGARPGVNPRSPGQVLSTAEQHLRTSRAERWGRLAQKFTPRARPDAGRGAPATPAEPLSKLESVDLNAKPGMWQRLMRVLRGPDAGPGVMRRVRRALWGGERSVTGLNPQAPQRGNPGDTRLVAGQHYKPGAGARGALKAGIGLSVAALWINYQACRDEGNSHSACMMEAAKVLAEAGITGAVAAKALAALKLALAAKAAPVLVVIGGSYAVVKSLDRLAEAEEVRQTGVWKKVESKLRERAERMIRKFEEEVDALAELRQSAIDAWQASKEDERKAVKAAGTAQDHFEELQALAKALKRPADKRGPPDGEPADLEAMRDRAEQLKRQVLAGIAQVKALAADIQSEDQARQIIQTHTNCKKAVVELLLLVEDARANLARIKALEADPDVLQRKLADIQLAVALIKDTEEAFQTNTKAARERRERFEGLRVALVARMRTLRRALPDDLFAAHRGTVEDHVKRFDDLRTQLSGLRPITEFTPAGLDPGTVTSARRKCEELLAQAEKLLAEIKDASKSIKDERPEEAVRAIEAAARAAAEALAGTEELVRKAQDYLAGRRFLAKVRPLTVRVQDEQGKPIQGATVAAHIGRRDELRRKILAGQRLTDAERKELQELGRGTGERAVTTDATGEAQLTVIKGFPVTIAASAEGYKSASTTLGADSPEQRITLTLRGAQAARIFLLNGYHTERDLPPHRGSWVSLFAAPDAGGGYTAQLLCVDAERAQSARQELAKANNPAAKLPFPEFFRHCRLASYPRYRGDYVLAITCNGQTRYSHNVYLAERPAARGIPTFERWGGGSHFGLGLGKHEAKVTVLCPEGKLAEFNISFAVERHPDRPGPDRVREMIKEGQDDVREGRQEAARAGDDPRRSANATAGVASGMFKLLKAAARYEVATPAQVTPLLEQFVQAWERALHASARAGDKRTAILDWLSEACTLVGSPGALAALERGLSLAEANAKALGLTPHDLRDARLAAAHLAIAAANDTQKARGHLRRYLELAKATGRLNATEAKEETWPKPWRGATGR